MVPESVSFPPVEFEFVDGASVIGSANFRKKDICLRTPVVNKVCSQIYLPANSSLSSGVKGSLAFLGLPL